MPTVFVPREAVPDETRIAAVPETVKKLTQLGYQVTVESNAGAGCHISDAMFKEAGATVSSDAVSAWGQADIVTKIHPPRMNETAGRHEIDLMKEGALLVSFLFPFNNPDLVKKILERKVSAFAMDQIPRISRAQNMDALTSQANIAGYKAVLMAADTLGKLFPLLMTAAGTIPPAKVVILGAGVAGLQAIATAKRLGAVVEVSDIRPAVKEQVHSLGAKFIEVETDEDLETEGGYAKEVSPEFLKKQQEVVRQHMVNADVVITTAQVPGKPAPKLIPGSVVEEMREGSVIVDLAVEQGGNCELSEPGKVAVKHGVSLIGKLNVPALVPVHASEVYAKNILNVMTHLTKDGEVVLDFDDEITAGSIIARGGELRNEKLAELAASGGKN